MDIDELVTEIENLDYLDLEKIQFMLRDRKRIKKRKEIKAKVEANKLYVGKCYKKKVSLKTKLLPDMTEYIKVISERGENEYYMSALVFYKHPIYWFAYKSHKPVEVGDYYLGYFDYEAIHVEDYPFFCNDAATHGRVIDGLTEITLEEYNQSMNDYIKELQGLTWYPDHYRLGGKLPTDPDWPQNRKV